jgi:hypothetical protein
LVSERYVLGIDDTDMPDTRGTGQIAREFAELIEAEGFGVSLGVSRHQLWDSPKVPMTEHNSALAIAFESERSIFDVEDYAVAFARERLIEGADPGVAILSRHSDMPHVLAFGRRAQQELLNQGDAERYASEANVRLRGIGGTRDGVIGALAAAGLRAGGKDGRYVGLRGLRDLDGRMTAGEIRTSTAIEHIIDEQSEAELDRDDVVDTLDWVRPRVVDGEPQLLTRRSPDDRKVWLPVDRKPRHSD